MPPAPRILGIPIGTGLPGLGLGRMLLAALLSWAIRGAAVAGALGILLGPAETLPGKVRDFGLAVPNAYRGLVHYLHADAHVDQFARTVEYLDEHAPSVEEVRSTVDGARTWIRRFEFSRARLRRGALHLGTIRPIQGFADIREGLDSLPPRGDLDRLIQHSQAMLDPAAEYLEEVRVDPIVQAARNAGDNLAPDEIASTLLTMLGLSGILLLTGLYIVTLWVRRGMPGWFARTWMKAGIRTNRDWYLEHHEDVLRVLGLRPEDVAGDGETDPAD